MDEGKNKEAEEEYLNYQYFIFVFLSDLLLKIKVQEKDEKSFLQSTNPDQSNTYTPLYKNYTQRLTPTISNF